MPRMMRHSLFCLGLLVSGVSAHAAESRFVQGSWINVRSAPSPEAPVLARLVVNTPVQLLESGPKFCAIAWSESGKGYTACNLLGMARIELKDVDLAHRPDGSANPNHSPLRAFWIAPTLQRFTAAGNHFWWTQLSAAQQALERPEAEGERKSPPKLTRFAIPEFEAMKTLLKQGVIGTEFRRFPKLEEMQFESWQEREQALFKGLRLPPVQPSRFKSERDIASPWASVEEVSAQFSLSWTLKVLGGPRWGYTEGNQFNAEPTGTWDVGPVEIGLTAPVVEHAVSRSGLMGAAQSQLIAKIDINGGGGGCGDEPLWPERATQPLPQRPRVKDALFRFMVPQALPGTRATVRSRTAVPKVPNHERLVQHEVDVDQDGVADFLLLEAWWTDYGDAPMRQFLFVNLAGSWRLLGIAAMPECS